MNILQFLASMLENTIIEILTYIVTFYLVYCIYTPLKCKIIAFKKIIDGKDNNQFNISPKRLKNITKQEYHTIITNYIVITSLTVTILETVKTFIIKPIYNNTITFSLQLSSSIVIIAVITIMHSIAKFKKNPIVNLALILISIFMLVLFAYNFSKTLYTL